MMYARESPMKPRTPELFTLQSLRDYCDERLKRNPDKAGYHIELRYFLLAAPPEVLEYDDASRTWIFVGVN